MNKQKKKKKKYLHFFYIFKSLASGKENVRFRFPDSPDFENLFDFRTKHDVQ